MELIKQAELVEVNNKDGKITMTFLGEGRVYDVNWNLRAYDTALNDYVESKDKEALVDEWSQKYFGVKVKDLEKKLGTKCDLYYYDTYVSLWESENKFTQEDYKKSFKTTIEEIKLDDNGIQIFYRWKEKDNKIYKSNKSFTQKVGDDYFLNPIRKRKQLENFEETYGVPIEQKDELIGQPIKVEVKSAFKKFYYGDITYLG